MKMHNNNTEIKKNNLTVVRHFITSLCELNLGLGNFQRVKNRNVKVILLSVIFTGFSLHFYLPLFSPSEPITEMRRMC